MLFTRLIFNQNQLTANRNQYIVLYLLQSNFQFNFIILYDYHYF